MSREQQTHVLITGHREWTDDYIIGIFIHGIRLWHGTTLHLWYGCAPGADTMAKEATEITNGWMPHPYPADWNRYGKSAGPRRNAKMLRAMLKWANKDDIVLCIAFKNDLSPNLERGGTEDMIKRCQRANVPVYHVEQL